MTRRLRVGVVGTGVITQVMHLPYLVELAEQFEVAAVCDIVPGNAAVCADRYRIPAAFIDWRDLLRHPLDAVLVATSGSHAPIAVAAAQAGLHVFTEKPMCLSVTEGREMIAAAERAGVTLMVGYPKRFDPAFTAFRKEVSELSGARLLRVTTFESPFRPYLEHHTLMPSAPVPGPLAQELQTETRSRLRAAVAGASEAELSTYHLVLLDTLVHELNTVRALLGEPDRLDYVDLREHSATILLSFGDLPVAIHWLDLPGIARYQMEFALYGPDRRVTLSFPSPYLRSEPATLAIEGGDPGTPRSWRSEEIASYESGFKRELISFHEIVTSGIPSVTSGMDGLHDVALCAAILRAHRSGKPVARPSDPG